MPDASNPIAIPSSIPRFLPCMMCSGTIVQFKDFREFVILDDRNFGGNEPFLRDRGV